MKDANNEQICRMFSFHSDRIAIISMLSVFVVNSIKVVENLNIRSWRKDATKKIQRTETIDS